MAFQWSGLCASNAGDACSIPGWGSRILQVEGCGKKKTQKTKNKLLVLTSLGSLQALPMLPQILYWFLEPTTQSPFPLLPGWHQRSSSQDVFGPLVLLKSQHKSQTCLGISLLSWGDRQQMTDLMGVRRAVPCLSVCSRMPLAIRGEVEAWNHTHTQLFPCFSPASPTPFLILPESTSLIYYWQVNHRLKIWFWETDLRWGQQRGDGGGGEKGDYYG